MLRDCDTLIIEIGDCPRFSGPLLRGGIPLKRHGGLFERLASFDHLMACARRAARGKRHQGDVARFRIRMARHVLRIQRALADGTWEPGPYREFLVREPKVRLISAAPFADRVVHHALVGVLESLWEPAFIHHSYACRPGKGTHQAVALYQKWSRTGRYFLKMDVRKLFPSIDHEILLGLLARRVKDRRVLALARRIVDGSNPQEAVALGFPDDQLRRRGLPIGNQTTSQFFANVYLDPLDHFVKERLRVKRYLPYCDDLVVLGESKDALWEIAHAIGGCVESLRLRFNPRKCFVAPVRQGLRLLGYRVAPDRIRLVRENVTRAKRRLHAFRLELAAGRISLDAVAAGNPTRVPSKCCKKNTGHEPIVRHFSCSTHR